MKMWNVNSMKTLHQEFGFHYNETQVSEVYGNIHSCAKWYLQVCFEFVEGCERRAAQLMAATKD